MSTSLNFNLFGNVLHRKQTNQKQISDTKIIYDGVLCVNGSHFGGVVELPLHAIIFSCHEKIGSMGEDKDPEDSTFHIMVPFFFSKLQYE